MVMLPPIQNSSAGAALLNSLGNSTLRVPGHAYRAPNLNLRPASTCFSAAVIAASVCLLLPIPLPLKSEIILAYVRI